MAMSRKERQEALQRYRDDVAAGRDPREAFFEHFPDGVPTDEDIRRDQAKKAQEAQLGQVAGVVGGALGAKLIKDQVAGLFTEKAAEEVAKEVAKEVASGAASAGAGAASNAAAAGAGTIAPPVPLGGEFVNSTAGAATVPASAAEIAQQAGSYIGPLVQAYNAYETLTGGGSSKDKGRAVGVQASTAVADYATGGLASLARGGVGLIPGGDEALEIADSFNPIGNIGAGIGSLAEGRLNAEALTNVLLPVVPTSLFFGALGLDEKSTKEYQQERWGRLGENAEEGSITADYLAQYAEEINNPTGKPVDLETSTGLELTPGLGFFEVFEDDWLEGFSEAQRIDIANRAREENLLKLNKGDIIVSSAENKDRLRQIGDEVLGLAQPQFTEQEPVMRTLEQTYNEIPSTSPLAAALTQDQMSQLAPPPVFTPPAVEVQAGPRIQPRPVETGDLLAALTGEPAGSMAPQNFLEGPYVGPTITEPKPQSFGPISPKVTLGGVPLAQPLVIQNPQEDDFLAGMAQFLR